MKGQDKGFDSAYYQKKRRKKKSRIYSKLLIDRNIRSSE